jgi:integrase
VQHRNDTGTENKIVTTPVFPDSKVGWRDPANTRRDIRRARGEEFSWVTSHVFRKTAATMLDEAGLTARQIANQLGHSRPSLTQDVHMGRGVVDPQAAAALERGLSNLFSMDKPSMNLRNESQDTA